MEQSLAFILSQPEAKRDQAWEQNLFDLLLGSNWKLISETPQTGPDGWPYIMVEYKADGTGEKFENLIRWCMENGVGLVLNPKKYAPDYIFTYGMIWYFNFYGKFIDWNTSQNINNGSLNLNENTNVIAGEPSKEYFPIEVRKILNEFLIQQGISDPKILVISSDQKNYDLCFSLESFGSPPDSEHNGILEALSWFFPLHYSLVLISENGLPKFFQLNLDNLTH